MLTPCIALGDISPCDICVGAAITLGYITACDAGKVRKLALKAAPSQIFANFSGGPFWLVQNTADFAANFAGVFPGVFRQILPAFFPVISGDVSTGFPARLYGGFLRRFSCRNTAYLLAETEAES